VRWWLVMTAVVVMSGSLVLGRFIRRIGHARSN
jgi:hypothetical protein